MQWSQSDQEFWHLVRSFLVRYNEYSRQKGTATAILDEFEHSHARTLAQQELKESAINRLTSLECRSDYHNLILLAFLHDLAKWSNEYYVELSYHPAPLEAIVTQSLQVLNNQQPFHTIVAKQNELIGALLPLPYIFERMDQLKALFRRLKDIKEYFPVAIREHQKKCFLTAVEQLVQRASKLRNIKVIEFVFGNLFNELEVLEETHQLATQRFKVMKKIAKCLWLFHEDIIFKLSYLIMKFSYHVTTNPHLYAHLVPIYDCILDRLLQRPAITALLVFKHLVLNNIVKILKAPSNSSCILLEGLLSQLAKVFTRQRLEYFMSQYDWNYLEEPICQQSLHILYQYTENRAHEKLPTFQLVKIYINRIHAQIKQYLEEIRGIPRDDSKWKFYELKRKEVIELQEEMNNSPKKIFKKIQSMGNPDLKEHFVNKCVKIVKKTAHIENKAMINLLASDHQVSGQLFAAYAELMLKQCKEHNLQEFIRMFTSNFFLTGESQQIARVLDTITRFFFSRQEEGNRILQSSDAVYTFANAILILNTDLHNPKNEEKISQQNFLKMCKKINDGGDIPTQILKKTYNNIKKNKINTFRERGDMLGISVSNWLALCTDYEALPLAYYDPQLQELDQLCLQYYIHDVLASIIDEKETAKLELLVERFMYDDKVFECEVIEVIRKVVDKKPHLPLHILEKILQAANFKNIKPSEKTLSYYWLAANLITTFPHLLPTNVICEYLVLTWAFRLELQDNMHLRQSAEIRRIKHCIKNVTKRESKKSIMDMFSNFLSFKESDDEQEPLPNDFNRRTNFKSISNNVFDILKYKDNHRKLAVQFLMNYIHQEQAKVYEEFLSCLFLTFNLLYVTQNCEQPAEDLFYELLGVKESSITKRLSNLGKKDPKLFNILTSYCKFWIIKLLLKEFQKEKLEVKQNNTYEYMLNKSLEFLEKVDREVLNDLIKEIQVKPDISEHLIKSFETGINKAFGNELSNEVESFLNRFKQKEKQTGKQKDKQSNKENQMIKRNDEKEKQEKDKKDQEGEEASTNRQNEKQQQKNSLRKDEDKKDDKQIQKEDKGKDEYGESPSESIEDKNHEKKLSLMNSVEPVNPDAMIEEIDRQIEEHQAQKLQDTPKKVQEQSKQNDSSCQVEGTEEELKREGEIEQQSPSIPVIMF